MIGAIPSFFIEIPSDYDVVRLRSDSSKKMSCGGTTKYNAPKSTKTEPRATAAEYAKQLNSSLLSYRKGSLQ